jgi:hypothetical protein
MAAVTLPSTLVDIEIAIRCMAAAQFTLQQLHDQMMLDLRVSM